MSPEPKSVKEIFLAAVDKPSPVERAAFLDEVCAGDAALRDRVEALLQAHDQPGSFLEKPAALENAAETLAPQSSEKAGACIGPYKLLQQIGEGGMGTVWMAEQTEPVRRIVALKIIKAGMDSALVIARFEAERQALALMDHPNIAKVLDAGNTENGRPFFVMELVKGTPITKYCDAHRLTVRQRLELFISVCQALQHAHQKGIIHRDLKPSNVLIAPYDGKPVVKVIDFGVAKATGPRLTERTLFTEFGAMIGTLEYMSPEQAELNNLDIDTRSDIYSLGVLLYELLTGTTPLDMQHLRGAALAAILMMIQEQEPPRPSTRLSNSKDSLPSISAQRQTEPAKLPKLVRGDLDWIVMKALEKDRNRRYETANGLAMDIQRFLADEPVLAGPPTAGYRMRKFLYRNRGPVVAAAVIFLLLVGGIVGTAGGMARALKAERAALADRDFAEEARQAEAGQRAVADEQRKQAVEARQLADAKAASESAALKEKDFALRRSEGLRLTAESSAVLDNNPGLALLLGIEGAQRSPRRAVHNNALLAALERCHEERTFRHESRVDFASVSPDGQHLLCASQYWPAPPWNTDDHMVRVWDLATGKLVRELAGHHLPIKSAAFSPNSKLVAFTYEGQTEIGFASGAARIYTDRVARVWDLTTGKEVAVLRGHKDHVFSAAFSPDGTRILTASWNSVRLWEVGTWKQTTEVPADESSLSGAGFFPDGKRIFTLPSGSRMESSNDWIGQRPSAVVDPVAGVIPPGIEPTDRIGSTSSRGGGSFHGGSPGAVGIWDAATGKQLSMLRIAPNTIFRPASVECTALSPDGERLFVANHSFPYQRAAILQVSTGNVLVTFASKETVQDASFSPDGQKLITIVIGGWARLWDATTGKELAALVGHDGRIIAARFSRNGRLVVTAAEDRTARVWDANNGKQVAVFRGHELALTSAEFTPDGQRVVTASADSTARVWRVALDRNQALALEGHKGPVNMISFSPHGDRLVTASEDKTAGIWDTASGRQLSLVKPSREHLKQASRWMQDQVIGAVRCATFSPDGRRLLTLSDDRIARVRFLKASPVVRRPAWEQLLDALAGLLPVKAERGKFVSADAARPEMLQKKIEDATQKPNPIKPEIEKEQIFFTPARIWNPETGKELAGLKGCQSEVLAASFGPQGNRVVTAEGQFANEMHFDLSDGRIVEQGSGGGGSSNRATAARIYDAVTGKQVLALPHKGAILSAVFSRDGRRLLTVGQNLGIGRQVRIWDVETGQEQLSLGDQIQVLWATFSPDGRLVLTMEFPERARIWNAQTGKELAKLEGPTDFLPGGGNPRGVPFNPFSPDSRRVALPVESRPYANVAAIWDVTTGKQIVLMKGHSRGIHSAVFSPDGQRVVTASDDETARIWDAETGAELYTLTGHKGAVRFATFSPDATRIATASADGTARIWLVDPLAIALARKPRDLTAEECARYEVGDGGGSLGRK